MGRTWDFYPKVHIQDDIGSISKNGNIFLTNIQRFVVRKEKIDNSNSMDYFLGNKPRFQSTENKILFNEIINYI